LEQTQIDSEIQR